MPRRSWRVLVVLLACLALLLSLQRDLSSSRPPSFPRARPFEDRGAELGAAPEVPLHTWMENGPPESAVDLLFVGDGYTAEDLGSSGQYWMDVWRVAGLLFAEPPLSWCRDRFNVRALFVESRESGCDSDPAVDTVDTALDACLESEERGVPRVRNEARLRELLQLAGRTDVVCVLVNEDDCSGSGSFLFGVQGRARPVPLATFSVKCPEAHEVAAHELGHALAGLLDEYVVDDELEELAWIPRAPNVTRHTRARSSPWRHFLELPGAERFAWHHEGACHRAKGFFRPWPTCRMSDPADPFCPVCCEAMARAVFRTCGLAWDDAEYHRAHPLELWAE